MKKNKKGFTLIEIIVVIVVLAVLLAVAVPAVLNYINEADDAKFMTASRSINQTVITEYTKEIVSSDNIDNVIRDMKEKYVMKNGSRVEEFDDILSGYKIVEVACWFDDLNYVQGPSGRPVAWTYDKTKDKHTISKISICFQSLAGNEYKFLVTINNDKMYFYDGLTELFKSQDKPEGALNPFN